MPEATGWHGTPTYFANVVTLNITVDEVVIELRRFFQAHKDLALDTQALKPISAPSPDEIFKLEPIARVVLTFSTAKALMQLLDQAVPQFEQKRREV